MSEIAQGDTARVKVEGKFHGQEVKVLAVKHKKSKTIYSLDVKWDEIPRPSWFDEDEIELVEHKERKKNEHK